MTRKKSRLNSQPTKAVFLVFAALSVIKISGLFYRLRIRRLVEANLWSSANNVENVYSTLVLPTVHMETGALRMTRIIAAKGAELRWDSDWPDYSEVGNWWPVIEKSGKVTGLAIICPQSKYSFGVPHRHWIDFIDDNVKFNRRNKTTNQFTFKHPCDNVSVEFKDTGHIEFTIIEEVEAEGANA